MQKQIFEINTGETKFWIILLIISVVITGYMMLNCNTLSNKLEAQREKYDNDIKTANERINLAELNANSRIEIMQNSLDGCEKRYQALFQSSALSRGALVMTTPQYIKETKDKCIISGMGAFIMYCDGIKRYTCGGQFVDEATYDNCGCLVTEPNCNRATN